MDGNGELKLFMKIQKKYYYFFWGGGRVGGRGGGGRGNVGFGGQGGCERRGKVFVKIQKKNFEGGGRVVVGGGAIRGWGGGGWGSKVLGRWVMWGMGV